MNILDLPFEILEQITQHVLVRDADLFNNLASFIKVCKSFKYLAKQAGVCKSVIIEAMVPKLKVKKTYQRDDYGDRLVYNVNRMYGFNFDQVVIDFLRNANAKSLCYPKLNERRIRGFKRGPIDKYLVDRTQAAIDRIELEGMFKIICDVDKYNYITRLAMYARWNSPIAVVRSRVNKLVGWYNDVKITKRWSQICKSTIDILTSSKSSIRRYVKCLGDTQHTNKESHHRLQELAAVFDKIHTIERMHRLCLYIASIYVNMFTYTAHKSVRCPRVDIFEYLLAKTPRRKHGVNIIVGNDIGVKLTRDHLQYTADVLARFIGDVDNADMNTLATKLAKTSFGFSAAIKHHDITGTFMSKSTACMVINTIHKFNHHRFDRYEVSAMQYFRESHDVSFERLIDLIQSYNMQFGDTFRKVIKPTKRGGKRVREKYQRMLVGRKQFNTIYKKYLIDGDIRSTVSLIDRKLRRHTIAYLVHVLA